MTRSVNNLRRSVPVASLLLLLALALEGGFAAAATSTGMAARLITAGSDFHGELSHESLRPTYLAGARYTWAGGEADRVRFGLGFDVVSLTVHQRGDAFPYEEDRRLDLLAFLLLPHACGRLTVVDLCGGIGLGTVNVNSPGNRQDYGTWHYETSLRYAVADAWTGEFVVKDIGKVEQEVAERDAAFWFIAYGVGLSRSL